MAMTRPIHWPGLIAALLVAAIGARLGLWQLDRAASKMAWQKAVEDRSRLTPLTAHELAADPARAADQWHRPVRLVGRWLAERTVLLDNRQMNGRPGFFVLTVFELEDGRSLLIQRGWLPRNAEERTRVEVPTLAPGPAEVAGRLAAAPSRLLDFGDAGRGYIRQNLDLQAYASEIGVALLPSTVQQMADGTPGDSLLRDWPRPAADVAKHHGYAFQWFALSALALALYVWYQFRRTPAAGA